MKATAQLEFSDPMRALIENLWPELVHKQPPKKPQGTSVGSIPDPGTFVSCGIG
jgi:hypothetical protein